MAILIDGYNLLHAAGIIPRGIGPGTLERARQALLNWLVATLEADQLGQTTVVFDAANPPPGLPRQIDHHGLTVRYSSDHEDADALLEELIRQDAVPKRLLVVSSDHRVQRAARRRRSTAVDSDRWYFGLREKRDRPAIEMPLEQKPLAPLSADEVQQWLDEFSDLVDELAELDIDFDARAGATDRLSGAASGDEPGAGNAQSGNEAASNAKDAAQKFDALQQADAAKAIDADLRNPFPPGYGEDLLGPDADLDR